MFRILFIAHKYQICCNEYIIWKCLNIPKRVPRSVNRRRTDKAITKRKRTKGPTTIYKTLYRQLKTEQHEHTKNWG